jgi:hypothetical protein
MIRHMIALVMTVLIVAVSYISVADAGDRDLISKASTMAAAEVSGLGTPDAKFLISSQEDAGEISIQQLAKISIDQGSGNIVERSSGCSTGCSNGCSSGCSSGCSNGCSVGCSVGCR